MIYKNNVLYKVSPYRTSFILVQFDRFYFLFILATRTQ